MRTILILALALVPALANAKPDKKIDLKPKHEKPEDPGSATHLIYETPKADAPVPSNTAKPKVTGTATCTDSVGMIYKQGDSGYAGCLRTMDVARPDQNDKRNRSVGISIGN